MFIFHCIVYKSSQKRQKNVYLQMRKNSKHGIALLCVAVGSGQGSN